MDTLQTKFQNGHNFKEGWRLFGEAKDGSIMVADWAIYRNQLSTWFSVFVVVSSSPLSRPSLLSSTATR
jgi:hypothetical protein